jgi:hypothetical protein
VDRIVANLSTGLDRMGRILSKREIQRVDRFRVNLSTGLDRIVANPSTWLDRIGRILSKRKIQRMGW